MITAIAILAPVFSALQILPYFLTAALFLIAVLIVLDVRSLPAQTAVHAARTVSRLEEADTADIWLDLHLGHLPTFHSGHWRVLLRDDYPDAAVVDKETIAITTGKTTLRVGYQLTPKKRGDLRFGDIHCRIAGAFGLLWRQYRVTATAVVPAWPHSRLTPAKRTALKRALQLQGATVSHHLSGSAEFAHIQDFAIGDDPRHINWFASARRGSLMKNAYQPERGQHVIFALDCGRTMGIAQKDHRTRLDLALEAVMLAAGAALQNGDDVSVIAFADTIHLHLKHVKGSHGLHQIIERTYNLEAKPVYSGFHLVADLVYTYHKRHSLLILMSDLGDLVTNDLFERNIRVLERRHTCVVTSFTDEALENAVTRPVRNMSDAILTGTTAGLINERQDFRDRLWTRGIEVVEAREEVFSGALNAYVRYKNAHIH